MIDRGYISVYVEIESGEYYSIWFFHPIRAQQELDHAVEAGRNFFTEEGALVLVPEVTVAAVVKAVKYLLKRSYFAY